jgi:hypothetical protein
MVVSGQTPIDLPVESIRRSSMGKDAEGRRGVTLMERAWQWIDKSTSRLALVLAVHSAAFALLLYLIVFGL